MCWWEERRTGGAVGVSGSSHPEPEGSGCHRSLEVAEARVPRSRAPSWHQPVHPTPGMDICAPHINWHGSACWEYGGTDFIPGPETYVIHCHPNSLTPMTARTLQSSHEKCGRTTGSMEYRPAPAVEATRHPSPERICGRHR